MSVALVDYGAGNLRSVANALKAAGAGRIVVTADPDAVRAAERIVLPGVGAFGTAMRGLRAVPGLVETLDETVRGRGRPFLGVCAGMQMMAERGEEGGDATGLGWCAGTVRALAPAADRKVPHMGWNDVRPAGDHPIVAPGEAYFLHGFAYDGADVIAETDHGGPVAAAIGRDTWLGVQFHPEKSQAYGLALLERFLRWRP